MNYFDYKFFHFLTIILFLFNLFLTSYNPQNKLFKITQGIVTLLLLGSGFLLMNRLGIKYDHTYPLWIWFKIGVWILLAIFPPVIIKRFPKFATKLNFLYIALIAIAAFMGIYKP